MNLSYFISQRLSAGKQSRFTGFIVRISVIATALSVATMIVSTCMVQGFRYEIANKLYGFWGHIQVRSVVASLGYDDDPINANQLAGLSAVPGIARVQRYAFKPAIIKTNDEIESVVLKGVGEDYDWKTVKEFIVDGKAFTAADTTSPYPVVLSSETANRLKLKVGDKIQLYFASSYSGSVQMNIRVSVVGGIYKTGLADFDKIYALCPLTMIQRLNHWQPMQVTGAEVFVDDVDDIERLGRSINEEHVDQTLSAKTIRDLYPNLFDWLDLQKTNETIILVLMTLVALVNLMTMLLILILERSNFIGIMKALGGSNGLVRRVFVYQSVYIIGRGLLFGNLFGLLICFLEYRFRFIRLPEDSYFVAYAPVHFDWVFIGLMNAAVFVVSVVVMIVPSWLVSRIAPVKVLRFS